MNVRGFFRRRYSIDCPHCAAVDSASIVRRGARWFWTCLACAANGEWLGWSGAAVVSPEQQEGQNDNL